MRISDWSSDVCSSDLLGEQRDRILVVGGKGDEIEFAVEDELRETLRIALFLSRQAAGAQCVELGRCHHLGGAAGPKGRFELVPDRICGGDADLLADDGAQQ